MLRIYFLTLGLARRWHDGPQGMMRGGGSALADRCSRWMGCSSCTPAGTATHTTSVAVAPFSTANGPPLAADCSPCSHDSKGLKTQHLCGMMPVAMRGSVRSPHPCSTCLRRCTLLLLSDSCSCWCSHQVRGGLRRRIRQAANKDSVRQAAEVAKTSVHHAVPDDHAASRGLVKRVSANGGDCRGFGHVIGQHLPIRLAVGRNSHSQEAGARQTRQSGVSHGQKRVQSWEGEGTRAVLCRYTCLDLRLQNGRQVCEAELLLPVARHAHRAQCRTAVRS